MPLVSQKNLPLTSTSADLGFGAGQLQQQLADETAEERRRRLLGLSARSSQGAAPILSPQTLTLFGAMGLGRSRGGLS
jgi:hypothetical protein